MHELQVQLIDYMGSDLRVVNAARVSFNKEKSIMDLSDEKLIHYLAKHQHWTPFAHTSITFKVTAPFFVRTQCFKHKVGFVENEISRRYVDEPPEFYHPEIWRARADNKKQGSSEESVKYPSYIDTVYASFLEKVLETYTELLNKGVAPELARAVLPQSTLTEWYWTASLAAYARFYNQRTHDTAQLEIKYLAEQVSNKLKNLFPISWSVLCTG